MSPLADLVCRLTGLQRRVRGGVVGRSLAPTILSMAAAIPTPAQMDGRSWLPLVFGGVEQLEAEAGWRHTFMVRRTIIAGIWFAFLQECLQ